jgi:hypothetical protein
MNHLKGYRTNPQVRILHNIKAVQSRKGWKQAEVFKAITDAEAGIAYEYCETCRSWNPLDCEAGHPGIQAIS